MAYVDKLVDTQDAVMHDFNGEDHDDGGTRSHKRSGEAYVADPPRPSTFLEGDFNMVMDDQCQFHRDAKHTIRVRTAEARPWSAVYLQEDQEKQQQRPERWPTLRQS
jgi:hypothetical protein